MSQKRKVFIVGPGFIGLNILDLLVAKGYSVSALVRRKEAGEGIKASGAEPVIGNLDNKTIITEHAAKSDIVIHTATADDLPSVQAILDGVTQRAEKGLSTIYIHNSGAAVFDDGAKGNSLGTAIYSDDKQQEIDAMADSAPHREIDLAILKVKQSLGTKAKIAIVVPPLIYGFNPRHARLSIQIPVLTRFAIKHGFAGHVGKGLSVISTIHVMDLARAYVCILHHMEQTAASHSDLINPYYFTESSGDQEPSWAEVAETIGEGLHNAGKIKSSTPREMPSDMYDDLFGDATGAVFGLNSRTRSERLAKLGWKPTEHDWRTSYVQDELPELLKEGGS